MDLLLGLTIVAKVAAPVVAVMLYVAALAAAVYMSRERGNREH